MVCGNAGHAFSFLAEAADELVLVLVAAAFPAAVGMAVVDRGELLHFFRCGKLAAVITEQRPEHFAEIKALPSLSSSFSHQLCPEPELPPGLPVSGVEILPPGFGVGVGVVPGSGVGAGVGDSDGAGVSVGAGLGDGLGEGVGVAGCCS